MQAAIPSEVEHLAVVTEKLATQTVPEELLQHHATFQAAHSVLQHETDPQKKQRCLEYIERIVPAGGFGRVMTLSFLVSVSQDAGHLQELHRTLSRPEFSPEHRHFFYWQLITRHTRLVEPSGIDPAAVYVSLLKSYRDLVRVKGQWIESGNRNSDVVVVITNQLLGLKHAPTADCLDYCHVLQSRLRKKVFLINTGDMPWKLPLPYYDPILFQHAEEYSAANKLPFRGEVFDFYQCRKPMPNLEEINLILEAVLSLKPSFILSLGHSNVTPDLCSEFVTVATMPFGTDLPRAAGNLFILPRKRRPDDSQFMEKWHISGEQIVESQYTFRLPDRSEQLTRADLGLPQDAYVIAVVGNRLDEEVDDRFAEEATALLTAVPQAYIAFMGMFSRFNALAQRYAVLAQRSAFLGHRKDISAAYECCDAYWNPPRYGGGSSAAFALAAGLPIFTRAGGDVANIVGPQFLFHSIHEIKDHVEHSLKNPDHRRHWAEIARTRFQEISDREEMIKGIDSQVRQKAGIRKSLLTAQQP